jgi:UDP-N-acetyl-2-amino-2-deoxyglucuronate dehydrogenase
VDYGVDYDTEVAGTVTNASIKPYLGTTALGKGFTIGEARNAIEMVHAIRHAPVKGLVGDYHPACREVGA